MKRLIDNLDRCQVSFTKEEHVVCKEKIRNTGFLAAPKPVKVGRVRFGLEKARKYFHNQDEEIWRERISLPYTTATREVAV